MRRLFVCLQKCDLYQKNIPLIINRKTIRQNHIIYRFAKIKRPKQQYVNDILFESNFAPIHFCSKDVAGTKDQLVKPGNGQIVQTTNQKYHTNVRKFRYPNYSHYFTFSSPSQHIVIVHLDLRSQWFLWQVSLFILLQAENKMCEGSKWIVFIEKTTEHCYITVLAHPYSTIDDNLSKNENSFGIHF